MTPLRGVKKGATWEQACADFLGLERRHLRGNHDRGDLTNTHWTIECVAPGRGQPLNLSQKMKEAKAEAMTAGTPERYLVIARRIGYSVEESFCVLPLWIARREIAGLVGT